MIEHVRDSPKDIELQALFKIFSLDTIASIGFSSRMNSFTEGTYNDFTYHWNTIMRSKQQAVFVGMFLYLLELAKYSLYYHSHRILVPGSP